MGLRLGSVGTSSWYFHPQVNETVGDGGGDQDAEDSGQELEWVAGWKIRNDGDERTYVIPLGRLIRSVPPFNFALHPVQGFKDSVLLFSAYRS
mgnify:CR=1 FL=1